VVVGGEVWGCVVVQWVVGACEGCGFGVVGSVVGVDGDGVGVSGVAVGVADGGGEGGRCFLLACVVADGVVAAGGWWSVWGGGCVGDGAGCECVAGGCVVACGVDV